MTKARNLDLPTRLREQTEQIAGEFAGVAAPEVVERCVIVAHARIADARVTDYAPIFFARHARRLIREATSADIAARSRSA